ncbi:MAG: DNA polymerase I [Thermoguttaceae bacterium]|jgi:DNA polymerase-1
MFDLTGKKTVVLDAHGILYQVFHTLRDMSGPKGQPTGAAYGFTRDVMNILLKFEPDAIFCAFDMPGETFRHDIFPDYKANRPPMPEDLKPQMVFVRQVIDALCIPRLEKDRYEADDLLATVARQTVEAGGGAILITSDKDARQLISDRVLLYNLRKELLYGVQELQEEWGIRPDQVVDFQTMVGDSTDNIHGIPLIGPKSATELLTKYGSLEEIFSHAHEIKGKKGMNLVAGRERAETTRQLVRLDDRVPIELDWERGALHGVDPDRLRELFREFGFQSLMPQIDRLVGRFGTRVSERDASLDGLYSMTEKKPVPQQTFFDAQPTEESASTENVADDDSSPMPAERGAIFSVPAESLAEENRSITDRLFRALGESAAVVYPDIDTEEEFPADPTYELVDTPEKFDALCEKLQDRPVISIDLETVDILREQRARPRFARIAGISLCFEPCTAYYIPFRGPSGTPVLPESETLEKLRPILESDDVKKIGQNIKYDMIVLRNYGIRLNGLLFDTMVADYLLRAGEQKHNMDELASLYLGHTTVKITDLLGTGRNQKMIDEVSTAGTARYAGEDALVPWYLYPKLLAELRRWPALMRLMTELEIPLISVLVELETNGVAINPPQFERLKEIFSERLVSIKEEITAIIRRDAPKSSFAIDFNMNSPLQLRRLLFEDLGLPGIKKTKTGWSTDVDVLEELAARGHELPAKLIEHRTLTKLIDTYVVPLPRLVHPITGRIHASFNQVVTATGRLSSSDPNLQNIPVRTDEGKEIRHGFVPDGRFGFDTFLSCDYSQIELRVLAHFSKDANLIRAFQEDLDIHTAVAAQIFHVPLEEVTSEQRHKAKAVNFGLAYGQTAFGLSKSLGIEQSEAREYIEGFFTTYSGIREFFDRVLVECSRTGCATTLMGRRRLIDGVRGVRGDKTLNMAERTAINTVIQGSAADLMKTAMVNVSKRLAEWNAALPRTPAELPFPMIPAFRPESGNGRFLFDMEEEGIPDLSASDTAWFVPDSGEARARLLIQIHDELLLETRREDAEDLTKLVVQEMQLGQPLSVPLKIDTKLSRTW